MKARIFCNLPACGTYLSTEIDAAVVTNPFFKSFRREESPTPAGELHDNLTKAQSIDRRTRVEPLCFYATAGLSSQTIGEANQARHREGKPESGEKLHGEKKGPPGCEERRGQRGRGRNAESQESLKNS